MVLIFDNDDTLVMNTWQYDQAIALYFAYLYDIFGKQMPTSGRALHALFDQLEKERFKKVGVRKAGGIGESLLLHYQLVCREAELRFGLKFGHVLHSMHKNNIKALGDMPFNYRQAKLLPEVSEVLPALKQKGCLLRLLSSYDPDLFKERAFFLGLDKFFDLENEALPVPLGKTAEDFIRVSGWTKEKDNSALWVAIGNGASDILPAVAISKNWRGVYIPFSSGSAYFNEKEQVSLTPPPLDHPKVKTISSLNELEEVLEEIQKEFAS